MKLLSLIVIVFVSFIAVADEIPPDDTKLHFRSSHDVPIGLLGSEWDYRLYWLDGEDGSKWAIMVNAIRTASFGGYLDQLQAAVFKLSTGQYFKKEQGGEFNRRVEIHARGMGWTRRSGLDNKVSLNFDILSRNYDIELNAVGYKPKIFFPNYDESGHAGILDNGSNGKAAYISQTGVNVTGEICETSFGSVRCTNITGRQWLDRQWSLSDTSRRSRRYSRWDWFGILLQNNRELMLYKIWNERSGNLIAVYGAIVDGDRVIAIDPEKVSIETDEPGRRGDTITYSKSWNVVVELPSGEELAFHLKYPFRDVPWYNNKTPMTEHSYIEGPCIADDNSLVKYAWCEQISMTWLRMR